jgi:hypothetical protein
VAPWPARPVKSVKALAKPDRTIYCGERGPRYGWYPPSPKPAASWSPSWQLRDAYAQPYSGLQQVPFPVAPDLGGEYSLAQNDQRHRVVLNGIWQLKYFSLRL